MKVDENTREDIYLKDFINKRSLVLNDVLRKLSVHCVNACKHLNPSEHASDFTMIEQQCLAKCEAKVSTIN